MTENNEMESESQAPGALQRCPSTMSITPVSKLQRLKCSLKFMRSKSVENFFQRSFSDARFPAGVTPEGPPPSPPLLPVTQLPDARTPSLSPSPSPDPSSSSTSPSSLSVPRQQVTHCFLEHVFRRPTSCQLCKHVIVGNSKQGLRCKTCKMGAHLWCSSELSQQPCQGKSGMFKRNFSSPLLGNEQLGVVKETQPNPDPKARVDPIYATLRYGTTLAQMSRSSFGSVCESPTRSLGEGGEEGEDGDERREEDDGAEREEEREEEEEVAPEEEEVVVVEEEEEVKEQQDADCPMPEHEKTGETEGLMRVPRQVHSMHTYVALYKFLPQEPNDLELYPGDRVQVTDDSNEEWWKGRCGDRIGFFPANFVQRVRPGERVWRVTQGVHGNRGIGHMAVKESQICVGKSEDTDGFLKLSSGKKKGLVPGHSLEEI